MLFGRFHIRRPTEGHGTIYSMLPAYCDSVEILRNSFVYATTSRIQYFVITYLLTAYDSDNRLRSSRVEPRFSGSGWITVIP